MKIDINQLSKTYEEILRDEGFGVKERTEEDGGDIRIVFKAEGMSYLIIFDNDDPEFVRVILPNFYSLDSDDEKLNALVAINHVALTCKGAKVHMNYGNDDMMAVTEFLDSGSMTATILSRYIKMVKNAALQFSKKMQNQ